MINHRGATIVLALVGGAGSLGFATIGGSFSDPSAPSALISTPLTSFASDNADPLDHLSVSPTVGLDGDQGSAMPKTNRLAPPGMLLAEAEKRPNFAPDLATLHRVTYSVNLRPGTDNETVVTPTAAPPLAYASLDTPASAAIDREMAPSPLSAVPIQPSETPAIAEEEDDATPTAVDVPVPRSKPLLDPSLPLPKLKPAIDPDSTVSNPGRIVPKSATQAPQPEAANPGGIAIRPPQRANPNILAFLTSPTESSPQQDEPTGPGPSTPGTIITPTPFGVPYVLQTQSVDTACLKPELLTILRQVERHYGRKVVITSGYRNRGREGSLHRICAAADIIVPGIDSKQLAAYARTIPSVGGVGTYCHQAMIHVDIGTPREWKYGCGSYFTMRDGSAHWGKVPTGVVQSQVEPD
ncbi:MAG: D-Ala-D-Ala carboxypeptidase family metallohydrolase [Ancalomicrobiaceae bacterium]|nr:D-Ala-D-Ala carboxypeptidase family metallohydrolase [Ancalomicrobiaceae bacterium]